MSETPARTPEFAQARSRRTYEALVSAADALFEERGYDRTGSPDIAARAGVSVGTFYRYFDDKKTIYLEVMDRRLTHAQLEILDEVTPARLLGARSKQAIEFAIQKAVTHVEVNRHLYSLLLEMSLRDDDVLALRRKFETNTRSRLATVIEAVGAPHAFCDAESAAFLIQNLVLETAVALTIRNDCPAVGRDSCLQALAAFVHRGLFGVEHSP